MDGRSRIARVGAISTICPAYMIAMRSQFSDTSEMSCVIRISAVPRVRPDAVDLGEDLILHDDVERRRRLISDDQGRIERHRHGDNGTLAHAAAELVRIAPDPFRLEPDGFEELLGTLPGSSRRAALVGSDRLDDLGADAVDRIERIHCALSDQAQYRASGSSASRRCFKESRSRPAEQNAPVVDRIFRQDAQDRARNSGFSAARFADDAERLAFADRVRHPADGMQVTAAGAEAHPQSVEFDAASSIAPAIWD